MKFIPLDEMSPELWYDAWETMFDPHLANHMGIDPALLQAKPTLQDFYRNIMVAHNAGRFEGWAIVAGEQFLGYTILDKRVGEWESATVLKDEKDWSSGKGAIATMHAFSWAFETDGAEWVVAYTQGKDPRVIEMHEKAGYKRLMNFWVFPRSLWFDRWKPRYDRIRRRYTPSVEED